LSRSTYNIAFSAEYLDTIDFVVIQSPYHMN
jgi:uncharacterized SAM-binding protein YcdF (DUF218 family)